MRLLSTFRQRALPALWLAAAALVLGGGVATPAASADPSVASKQAEAQQVLAQVGQLDRSLDHAVQAYDAAAERLNRVRAELRANQHLLQIALANLKRSQATLARRLIDLYTFGDSQSTIEVLLGADNLDGVLSNLDAQDRVGREDAYIVRSVTRFKRETEQRQAKLKRARADQTRLVAERAAAQRSIEQQLASRRQLLSSVRGEIERLRAVHAPHTGDVVKISSITGWYASTYVGARRY